MARGEETGHTVWLRLDTGGGGVRFLGAPWRPIPKVSLSLSLSWAQQGWEDKE